MPHNVTQQHLGVKHLGEFSGVCERHVRMLAEIDSHQNLFELDHESLDSGNEKLFVGIRTPLEVRRIPTMIAHRMRPTESTRDAPITIQYVLTSLNAQVKPEMKKQ